MIICGLKNGENVSANLYEGTLEQCKAWCRTETPAEYESLNICENNGVIALRIFKNGQPTKDFLNLLPTENGSGGVCRNDS